MRKIVYKITNNINGKIYIGQTNNLDRRIREHKYDKRNNHPIHNAIEKYGFKNFSVEVLYEGEDYNNKEIEYIDYYKSRDPEFGYNITIGGQDSNGENNPAAVLTDEVATNIKMDLIYSSLPINKIAEKYDVPVYFVNHINHGEAFAKDFECNFPFRKTKYYYKKRMIPYIIQDLKNPELSLDDICNKYHIKRYTLTGINSGKIYISPNEHYPIRELFLPTATREKIIDLLKNSDLSVKEIAKAIDYQISESIIYSINLGKVWFNPDLEYPIRQLKS